MKALYGSWAKELFAVDVEDYEDFMKDFNSGTSPSHHAKVCKRCTQFKQEIIIFQKFKKNLVL